MGLSKAFILVDKYDDPIMVEDLKNKLSSENFEILVFDSLVNLESSLEYLDPSENYLFFPSVYIRYPLKFLKDLYEKTSFDYLKTNNFIFSFKPKSVLIGRDGFYAPEDGNKRIFLKLKPFDSIVMYEKPNIPKKDLPRVVVYTHNRDTYFKLTVNSLMHALHYNPEIPVTLLLSEPTKEVLQVACEFLEKYPQVQVLKCEKNIAYLAPSIAMQWYDSRNYIFMEDDMVLPESLRHTHPMWPYQYAERLKSVDYISCKVNFSNIPYGAAQEWKLIENGDRLGWDYFRTEDKPNVMAQMFSINVDFFKKVFKGKPVMDTVYLNHGKSIAVPNFQGYHIGWNQTQDHYFSYHKWIKGFDMEGITTQVKDIRTSKVVTINTDDLIEN